VSPRFYTEIRISHKTKEGKKDYEDKFNKAIINAGYKDKNEFIREKIRELAKEV